MMRGWILAGVLATAGSGILMIGSADVRRWLRPVAVGLGVLPPRHETAAYRARIVAFTRENDGLAAPCTVLLGDSLSEGFPRAHAGRLGLVNRGISGDRVADLARRLDVSVLQTPCQQVLLLGGTNDVVLDGADPAPVANRLLEIAERVAATARHVVLVALPPTSGRYASADEPIREYNRHLRTAARERGFGWVDLYRALEATDGSGTKALEPDGLHLDALGYERFVALVEKLSPQTGSTR